MLVGAYIAKIAVLWSRRHKPRRALSAMLRHAASEMDHHETVVVGIIVAAAFIALLAVMLLAYFAN